MNWDGECRHLVGTEGLAEQVDGRHLVKKIIIIKIVKNYHYYGRHLSKKIRFLSGSATVLVIRVLKLMKMMMNNGGTMQKSEVKKRYRISDRIIAYVWYSWHFVISCICVFVYMCI